MFLTTPKSTGQSTSIVSHEAALHAIITWSCNGISPSQHRLYWHPCSCRDHCIFWLIVLIKNQKSKFNQNHRSKLQFNLASVVVSTKEVMMKSKSTTVLFWRHEKQKATSCQNYDHWTKTAEMTGCVWEFSMMYFKKCLNGDLKCLILHFLCILYRIYILYRIEHTGSEQSTVSS